jgi:hypothetical protein
VGGKGWTASSTKNGHIRLTSPNWQVVILPSTPSDHRALKNARALLRRISLLQAGEGGQE